MRASRLGTSIDAGGSDPHIVVPQDILASAADSREDFQSRTGKINRELLYEGALGLVASIPMRNRPVS